MLTSLRLGEVLLLTTIHIYLFTFIINQIIYRYLREPDALGTAGGLYHFRDDILSPLNDNHDCENKQVQAFFVMNGDVCADFPLEEMLDIHFNNKQNHPVLITVMATETTRQQSVQYGMY